MRPGIRSYGYEYVTTKATMMNIQERFELLKRYMEDVFIPLVTYATPRRWSPPSLETAQRRKSYVHFDEWGRYRLIYFDSIPTFDAYCREPHYRSSPCQVTMVVNKHGKLTPTYYGGVYEPIGKAWAYYYRYNTASGCRYNVTEKTFNPHFSMDEGLVY